MPIINNLATSSAMISNICFYDFINNADKRFLKENFYFSKNFMDAKDS